MATGGEKISPSESHSPNAGYLLDGTGRGTGAPMVSASTRGLVGGPQEEYQDRTIGTDRYDLSDRPVKSRHMYSSAPRAFGAGQGRKM